MKARVNKNLNRRIGVPSVNAPRGKYHRKGTIIEVEEVLVQGDFYEGNNYWYKDRQGNFCWSGALVRLTDEELAKLNSETASLNVVLTPVDKKNQEEFKSPPIENESISKETNSLPIINEADTKNVPPVLQIPETKEERELSSIPPVIASANWSINDYQINSLWKISNGKGISVAILDSGLNYHLPEFKSKTAISYFNAFTNSEIRVDCKDDMAHQGTDCAAILCGMGPVFSGIAPGVTLNIIKIAEHNNRKNTDAFARGLERSIEMKSDIIVMNFHLPSDDNFKRIRRLIKHAFQKGIVLIAPADNHGTLKFPVNNYPASFPECISVGSVNRDKTRSIISAKSDFLNLMAPGEGLPSVSLPETLRNGTNFATPFVAGVVAILLAAAKERDVKLSAFQLIDILKKSADKKISGYNTLEYGWGIINPTVALDLIIAA